MRGVVIAAACVAAIALPSMAVGLGDDPFDPEYGGKIDDKKNRYIGFKIAGKGNDRVLKKMFIVNVPFTCEDPADSGRDGGFFQGKFEVDRNGRFSGTRKEDFRRRHGGPSGLEYTLKGKLEGKTAEGTLDTTVLGSNCESGKVEWVAKKPPPPVPQS